MTRPRAAPIAPAPRQPHWARKVCRQAASPAGSLCRRARLVGFGVAGAAAANNFIPPEGGGAPITRVLPQEQGPTVVPGVANPVPNLPHGTETFQDRASRCAFQSGLYGVPGTARSQYMGGCVQ